MRLLDMKYFNDYVDTQSVVIKYIRSNENCPIAQIVMAKVALERLRDHLDANGLKMPSPRYIYNHHDERTWEYVPTEINNNHYYLYRKNPNFLYRMK